MLYLTNGHALDYLILQGFAVLGKKDVHTLFFLGVFEHCHAVMSDNP